MAKRRILPAFTSGSGVSTKHTSLVSSIGQSCFSAARRSRFNLSVCKVVMVPFDIGCDFLRLSFQF